MASDEPIRVLIGEPAQALRARMRKTFKDVGNIKVIAEAQDLADVLQQARECCVCRWPTASHRPD